STTSRPPPSRGTRMTMPRPSLVTSSGPSPVRGFIAAMRASLPALGSRGPRFPTSPTTRNAVVGVFTSSVMSYSPASRALMGNDLLPECVVERVEALQTGLRARTIRPVRPVRRPPAITWRAGVRGRSRTTHEAPGNRCSSGAYGRFPDGPAGLAAAGPAAPRTRLRAHSEVRQKTGPGGVENLPSRDLELGRPLAFDRVPARQGTSAPRTRQGHADLPRLRRAVRQHLDRPALLHRTGQPAGERGNPGR